MQIYIHDTTGEQFLVINEEREREYLQIIKERIDCHLADWDSGVKIPSDIIEASFWLDNLCDFIKEKWGY